MAAGSSFTRSVQESSWALVTGDTAAVGVVGALALVGGSATGCTDAVVAAGEVVVAEGGRMLPDEGVDAELADVVALGMDVGAVAELGRMLPDEGWVVRDAVEAAGGFGAEEVGGVAGERVAPPAGGALATAGRSPADTARGASAAGCASATGGAGSTAGVATPTGPL
jgi:hypothetical protein